MVQPWLRSDKLYPRSVWKVLLELKVFTIAITASDVCSKNIKRVG